MTKKEILNWLTTDNSEQLEELWQQADETRRRHVGDEVHLRGLLEISNRCIRQCSYCGLRAAHSQLPRYTMSDTEILECALQASDFGYGTVVLQAGEHPSLNGEWIASIVQRIKEQTSLAVTLSLGERSEEDLSLWRQAGADRYLLRFETSNNDLYNRIHPPLPGQTGDRMQLLRRLKTLGYETGSGVMIGIPGQTYNDLAEDILSFARLGLDMIGVGPYIPHGHTPLGHRGHNTVPPADQVPNTEEMTYRVVALARLVCPDANIPSTSALATLNKAHGRELGLVRGANIVMPNVTPREYRAMYEIYPAKACIDETAAECRTCMAGRIRSIGRQVGQGRGDSPNIRKAGGQ